MHTEGGEANVETAYRGILILQRGYISLVDNKSNQNKLNQIFRNTLSYRKTKYCSLWESREEEESGGQEPADLWTHQIHQTLSLC